MGFLKWFKEIANKIDSIQSIVTKIAQDKLIKEIDSQSLIVLRHSLGSIDKSDYKDEMTEQERKDFVAIISSVNKPLTKLIDDILSIQKNFALQECDNWEQIIFSRGTINGLSLVSEKLKEYTSEHIGNVLEAQEKEKLNQNKDAEK